MGPSISGLEEAGLIPWRLYFLAVVKIGVIRLWSKSQLGDRTECVVLRWGKLGVMRFYPGAQLGTEAPRIQTPWREVRRKI